MTDAVGSARRRISSIQTFFWKWVFPSIWIAGFGWGTFLSFVAALYGRGGRSSLGWMEWQFLALWLIGSAFLVWLCGRLKRVHVDNDALYVSNYWSVARIPLTEVSHFTQSVLIAPPTVAIHLRRPSAFGLRVVFSKRPAEHVGRSRWPGEGLAGEWSGGTPAVG
jgi:hypothetical protein